MLACSGSGFTHSTKSVSIVYHQAEIVFLSQLHDTRQIAQIARHTEDSFGNHQNSAVIFFSLFGGKFQHFIAAFHIVVREYKALSAFGFVQKNAVHDAGVRL